MGVWVRKVEVVSIELTNRCGKGKLCGEFGCYAKSLPEGLTFWTPEKLETFIRDLAWNEIQAVSFGGGEPLQYEGLWDLLERLKEVRIWKSLTTNGLLLKGEEITRLARYLNKVHVSVHFPEDEREVKRVIRQVKELEEKGLKSGINFLVKGRDVESEKRAVLEIKKAGIGADRVVFLPLRGKGVVLDLRKFREVAEILGNPFQAVWCVLRCGKSERFVSVDWEGKVGWCSYTEAKTKMEKFTYRGMIEALEAKELVFCG